MAMSLIQAGLVTGFVLVHIFAGKLRFLDGIPRSRWLSSAGGISVAYVFMHVFPELAAAQQRVKEGWDFIPWIEHHAYIVALGGLVLFYGLERIVKASQRRRGRVGNIRGTTTSLGIFWLHISSFSVYNALVGYLLVHREEQGLHGLFLFFIAMAVHFLVNDYGLRQDHKEAYTAVGRWVLAAAILIGWAVGLLKDISEAAIGVLFAFLAGGVVLNVLKEELPEDRESRFAPFVIGAASYTVLLLL